MNCAIDSRARWIKIFWAIGGLAALALMPLPMMAGLGAVGIAGAIILWKHRRLAALWNEVKPIWPLLLILGAFFYFPFSSVDPRVRASGEYFTIYNRFVAGLSIWEILLLTGFGVLFWRKWRSGSLNLSFGNWQGIPLYLLLLILAIANGLLHVEGAVLGYGPTELSRVVIASMPIGYFLAVFLLIINFVENRRQATLLVRWLDRLTIGLVIYGVIRFALILSGHVVTMMSFGLPIVLYDQMNLFYVPVFVIVAKILLRERLGSSSWLYFVLMLFFILCSTRRFNYLLLAMGTFAVILLGLAIRVWNAKRILAFTGKIVFFGAGVLFMVYFAFPSFVEGVTDSVRSIDMFSKFGQRYGGDSRAAQVNNIFSNLQQRPYTYLVGFGIGTKWQAIERQPFDSMAFPQEYMRQSKGWYPKFHLPYIALVYRFGILGLLLLLVWQFFYLKSFLHTLHTDNAHHSTFCIGMIAFIAIGLPMLGDSTSPVMPILCGLYMGILERLTLAANHLAPAATENESQHHSP